MLRSIQMDKPPDEPGPKAAVISPKPPVTPPKPKPATKPTTKPTTKAAKPAPGPV